MASRSFSICSKATKTKKEQFVQEPLGEFTDEAIVKLLAHHEANMNSTDSIFIWDKS